MKITIQIRLILIIMGFAVASSSCVEFEPDLRIVDYAYTLPNYCDDDLVMLSVLETETKEYGRFLAEKGYFGEWDGLLWGLMRHHFLWGNYLSTVKFGGEFDDASDFVEYCVAKYMSKNGAGASEASNRWLEGTRFEEIFLNRSNDIAVDCLSRFDGVDTLAEFENWAGAPIGLDSVIILSARLLMDEDLESESEPVVQVLRSLLTHGDNLDRFFGLTNSVGSWPWDKWLQASLLFERYALESGNVGLVAELRSARRGIGRRMLEADRKLNWVSCVLDESGVFEAK
ncbi:hypothetical protein MLD52_22535 [Puniceicoccaceae bacterium K14]|nr:hypothetical protein [Puniceicoccaceae bacterium K14]